MNSCERSTNSFCRRSDFFVFGHDVDVPAGQLRGETDILAAAADGQRELLVGNDDFDALRFLVENDLGHFGRLQGIDDEGRCILRSTE